MLLLIINNPEQLDKEDHSYQLGYLQLFHFLLGLLAEHFFSLSPSSWCNKSNAWKKPNTQGSRSRSRSRTPSFVLGCSVGHHRSFAHTLPHCCLPAIPNSQVPMMLKKNSQVPMQKSRSYTIVASMLAHQRKRPKFLNFVWVARSAMALQPMPPFMALCSGTIWIRLLAM